MKRFKPWQIVVLFLLLVFCVGGIFDVFLHDIWAYEPAIYKFIYGGVFSLWDAVLGLALGAYIAWKHHKKVSSAIKKPFS